MLFQASMFCAERANETVEKPIMGRAYPVREPSERPNSQVAGRIRYFPLVQGSEDRSKGVDLADIVNQGEQPPLYIHFGFGTKGKTMHALLHTSSPWFPFRTVFQIEINFQLRGLPPLILLFIGGWVWFT